MVIVELLIDIMVYEGLTLERKKEYVMAGAVFRQLLKIYPGGLNKTKRFEDHYRKVNLQKLKPGDEVFMFRSGGIGDVMFMIPLIRYLKEKHDVKIKVATSPMYCQVMNQNPYVDSTIQMPFLAEELAKSDYHLMFEGVIEDPNKRAQYINAIDLFLEEAGVNFDKISFENKIPYLYLDPLDVEQTKKEIKKLNIDHKAKKIGIQVESSSPIRTFPIDKIIVLSKKLLEEGHCVFVFGGKKQQMIGEYLRDVLLESRNFVNLIFKDISLKGSILYCSQMDVMIAPDSAFIHVAGGLGVPVVGLYSCFASLLRMKYYRNAIGIDCNVPCAPSFTHGHSPCVKGFPSPCFSVISIQNILDAVNHLLGKEKIQSLYPIYNLFVRGEFIPSPFATISVPKIAESIGG